MNLLLDTHVVLWWYENPKNLSQTARKEIGDTANEIYISSVFFWECTIKSMMGKLVLPEDFLQRTSIDFSELAITSRHACGIRDLPLIHNDPFDRLLMAQAKIENFSLVTRDKEILKYPDIKILKA